MVRLGLHSCQFGKGGHHFFSTDFVEGNGQ